MIANNLPRKPRKNGYPVQPGPIQVARCPVGERWQTVSEHHASPADAESDLIARMLRDGAHYRVQHGETGRWLDDVDAANGRSYLCVRTRDGTPLRSYRYTGDGAPSRDSLLAVNGPVQWALGSPKDIDTSTFDPRKVAK